MAARNLRRAAVALALALSLLALIQAHHRAGQGRSAILKWGPAFAALEAGEPLYEVGEEGYPTLPLTLFVMAPFHGAGAILGPLAWAVLQVVLAWWIVTRAFALAACRRTRVARQSGRPGGEEGDVETARCPHWGASWPSSTARLGGRCSRSAREAAVAPLAKPTVGTVSDRLLTAGRARDFPPLGMVVVLLLALRPLLSDVLHGNVNILVGATVAAAAWAWSRGRSLESGLWIGFGAVLKVTPALGLLYFAWKRSGRALAGAVLGIAAGAFVLPGALLGWWRNLELARGWSRQMIVPYLAGGELALRQTEHINQSLLGVLARLTTGSVAIPARPPLFPEDARVNLLSLDPGVFRALHLGACVLVVGWLCFCWSRTSGAGRAGKQRTGLVVLGEFSLLALAMLFLSERSWKHHYVLSAFPLAFLVRGLLSRPGLTRCRVPALLGLMGVLLGQGLTGTAFLGPRWSDRAEAYGAFLAGGLALFVACGLCLRRMEETPPAAPGPPGPSRHPGETSGT